MTAAPSAAGRVLLGIAWGLGALCAAAPSAQAQSVPGFDVSTYASAPDPSLLSFGPDGVLYTGGDTIVAGGATPVKINKIGVGGAPVTQIGDVPISDPDTCVLDVEGTISGVPGTVLVGGVLGTTGVGRISGIHPDGTVVTLFENSTWANVVEMKFDHTGRLLFTDVQSRSIWVTTGGAPTKLATLPGAAYPTFLSIAADDTLVVGASDNVIRIYGANGTLLNAGLASVGKLAGVEVGPGGAFGTDVYALDSVPGTLVRIAPSGVKTTVGTGFPPGLAIRDLEFGPSGDLFVSIISTDTILIVTAQWEFLGGALPGSTGWPLLVGTGTLAAGSANAISLTGARPNALAGLFLGTGSASLPFKGGTLKPSPFVGPFFAGTGPAGGIHIPFVMSAGVPSGVELVAQWAIQDPAAIYGVALSNGVRGVTP